MKALKTLLVRDGKVIEERLVEAGQPVEVEGFVVLQATGSGSAKGYRLRFTESMTGRLATPDFRGSLSKLRRRTSTDRVAEVYTVPLSEADKGSIQLEDGVALWFKFVEPPEPIDDEFRPPLLEEDDPVFLGWLGTWSAAATVLLALVWSAAAPEVVLEELPPQYTRVYVPEERPVEPDDEPREREQPEVAARAEKTTEKGKGPKSKLDRARRRDQVRKDVVKKSALLSGLGVKGKDKGAAGLWDGAPGIADVDEALRGAKDVFLDGGPRLRTGTDVEGGPEVLDDEDLGPMGDGPVVVDEGPDVAPVPTVELEEGVVEDGTTDASSAREVVKANYGQLRFCYERELRGQDELEGRIELGWSVRDGAVDRVWMVSNNTGSDALAGCLVQRISRWSFGEGADGEMAWPFVFRTE